MTLPVSFIMRYSDYSRTAIQDSDRAVAGSEVLVRCTAVVA
jgi:hypothetical protein